MQAADRDVQNLCGGGLLIVLGLLTSIYSGRSYEIGTVEHMGPGMMPFALGIILAGLGAFIFVPALFRAGAMPAPNWRPFLAISASTAAFALAIDRFGLVPAILLTTVVASLADSRLGPLGKAVLAGILTIVVVAIFSEALGLPVLLLRWPY